jgi:glutathione S-transferase
MKLYFSKGACSLAVRIVAHELGLKLEYESVDLHTKKTASGQDYWIVDHKGSVPALVLNNGEVLTENAVIQMYLADTHPSSLLPPVSDFQRYRVLEWLNFISTEMHKSFSPLFNPKVPQEIKESIFVPVLKGKLNFVEKLLAGHTYLTGETFTLPDAYCFVTLRWLASNKIALSDYPNLHRFFNAVAARPAVAAALAEELKG